MSLETRPDPATPDFRISAPGEVATLLKSLMDSAAPVHLSAPHAGPYSTSLWSIDGEHKRLSLVADPRDPKLQGLLDSGEATAVAYLDHIKLQFDLACLVLVHGTRRATLHAAWPVELFRFQRRQAFRVRPLLGSAPMALLPHPAIPEMALELRVMDVSASGCALFVPDDVPPLNPGVRIHRAQLWLDAATRIEATLSLCHVTSINPGAPGVRIGCELMDMSPDSRRALQRYIDQTQKRRRVLQDEEPDCEDSGIATGHRADNG